MKGIDMMFFSRCFRFLSLFFHLSKAVLQIVRGAWYVSKLKMPIVSIFGSSRMRQDSSYASQAHMLGHKLSENGISILTGGGPGIMEAASCSLPHDKNAGKSIGIAVAGLEEHPENCMQDFIVLDYFFARKWLLSEYSSGFVIFPGGFGTLDEMAGVLTLIQTKKLKRVPVVLIGKEYWHHFIQWIEKEALPHGAILKEELDYFYVTDDLDEAICFVLGKCDILPK